MPPAFDPQAVKALAAAYDDACAVLHVVDRADPRATIVAKKIIEHAQHGERDPIRLRNLVLIELQLAVHCGNGFDTRFEPYESPRLSGYNAVSPELGSGL